MHFTISELRTLRSACSIAHQKKDLELRKVRRNKGLINSVASELNGDGEPEHMAAEQQMESIAEQKKDLRLMRNKIDRLIEKESQ